MKPSLLPNYLFQNDYPLQTAYRPAVVAGKWLATATLLLLAACASSPPFSPTMQSDSTAVILDAAKREDVAMTALALLDTDYRYGGASPDTGFDCSGLVQYVMAQVAEVQMPRTTAQQAGVGRHVQRRHLKTGDLVFFNTRGQPYSHVGIYLHDGLFINAPSSGGRVRIDKLDNPYFARRFHEARSLYAD